MDLDLFRRTQDENDKTSKSDSKLNIENDLQDIENDKNRQEKLQTEIKNQNQHLESILKKLADVKKEYDQAVWKLISVKKELIQKKKDLTSLNSMTSASKVSSSEKLGKPVDMKKIMEDKTLLEKLQDQIIKGKNEFEKNKEKNVEYQKNLELLIAERRTTESRLDALHIAMKKSQKELENIETKKQEIVDDIKTEKNKMQYTDIKIIDHSEESKHVVAAASEVVANMKKKVSITEKELQTIKQLLKKERDEHQSTKNQLELLKKSKTKSSK